MSTRPTVPERLTRSVRPAAAAASGARPAPRQSAAPTAPAAKPDAAQRPLRRSLDAAPTTPALPEGRAVRPQRGAPTAPAATPALGTTGRGRPAAMANAAATPDANRPVAAVSKPEDMLVLVTELRSLLACENTALKGFNFAVVHDLQNRKQALTRAYLQLMLSLRKDPAQLADLSDDARATLKAAASSLTDVMTENAGLLKSRIDASNSFIGAVVGAVRDASRNEATYDDDGRMDGSIGEARAMAVALNREL